MIDAVAEVMIVLVFGGAVGWLSLRLGFPNAVAQVVLGVFLGSAVLGWVPHGAGLHSLGEFGVVLLLGVAGLEVGLGRLRRAGWAGVFVAIIGILLSVVGGFTIAIQFGYANDEALYLGLALGATSIGITAQVLKQFGLMGHRVADTLLAAAVIDDVIALYLLGAAHGFLSEGHDGGGPIVFLAMVIAGMGVLFSLCSVLTKWVCRRHLLDHRGWRAIWIVAAVVLAAWLTHSLELSSVVGAFFAGIGVGEGLSDEHVERSVKDLQPSMLLFMPFFFVMIGVQAQLHILNQPALMVLMFSLLTVAVISKVVGGVVGAFDVRSWRQRWLIGFGMVARGEVALVIGALAFDQGHMTQPVLDVLVLMTIIVTVMGPLMMGPLARRLRTPIAAGAIP